MALLVSVKSDVHEVDVECVATNECVSDASKVSEMLSDGGNGSVFVCVAV